MLDSPELICPRCTTAMEPVGDPGGFPYTLDHDTFDELTRLR